MSKINLLAALLLVHVAVIILQNNSSWHFDTHQGSSKGDRERIGEAPPPPPPIKRQCSKFIQSWGLGQTAEWCTWNGRMGSNL